MLLEELVERTLQLRNGSAYFCPAPGREAAEWHDHEEHILRPAASGAQPCFPQKSAHLLRGYGVGGFVVVGTGFGVAGRRGTARLRETGAAAACTMDGESPATVNSAG
jgi:hypothetical protein